MQARTHSFSTHSFSANRPPVTHACLELPMRSMRRTSACSAAGGGGGSKSTTADLISVFFREEGVSVAASPGEDIVEVATRCGVVIPTGCWQGNCGVCEVEVYKYTGDTEQDKTAAASPAVVRACITKLPPGYSRIEVAQMQDAIWGLDGFDT